MAKKRAVLGGLRDEQVPRAARRHRGGGPGSSSELLLAIESIGDDRGGPRLDLLRVHALHREPGAGVPLHGEHGARAHGAHLPALRGAHALRGGGALRGPR